MALKTKPRWDKYDGYVGNHRAHLAADIDLDTQANVVLAVGYNSDGAVVVGAGQSGIKGLMIVPVGADIHGNLLDGGINNMAGDPCDVGKHGEITNFVPTSFGKTFGIQVTATDEPFTLKINGKDTAGIAPDADAAAVQAAVIAVDDGFENFTVTGSSPNFTVVGPPKAEITAGTGVSVVAAGAEPEAGTNYYGHPDGSVNSVKGSNGTYVGHTVESSRLVVNVNDATP